MTDTTLTLHYAFDADRNVIDRINGLALDVVRADATATRTNALGLIEGVAANTARFDHDPITGDSIGLLVEEARTNICLQSEDFTTTWGAIRASISANSTTAPDGETTADTLVEDGTSANDHYVRQQFSFVSGTTYAYSVDVQAVNRSWILILMATAAFPANALASFDVTNGVTGNLGSGALSSSIKNIGNGWFRCTPVATADVTTSEFIYNYVAEGDDDNIFDGLSQDSLYLWGAQLEAGAFPTSYIPTTSSSVTRNADVVSTADLSWLNTSAGTKFVDLKTGFVGQDTTIFSLHDGTANERIAVEIMGGNIHFIGVDGTTQWDISTAVSADTDYKIAVAWSSNDIVFYLNGTQVGVDALATLPTVTTLNIGSDHADAEQVNTTIREDRYYNVRKDNTFLEDLSNGIFHEMQHRDTNKRHNDLTRRHQNTALQHRGDLRHTR